MTEHKNTNVPLYSTEGRKRLLGAVNIDDFFRLIANFQPQMNAVYSGIASAVIIANTLRIRTSLAPRQPALECVSIDRDFRTFSQMLFLCSKTEDIKKRAVVAGRDKLLTPGGEMVDDPGVSLGVLARMLEAYDFNAEIQYAQGQIEDVSEQLRYQLLSKGEDSTDTFLIANFASTLTTAGATGGYMSPIAAYHEESDSVLVLDVASHLSPWNWIPMHNLAQSMSTFDGRMPRGWLTIWDNPPQ